MEVDICLLNFIIAVPLIKDDNFSGLLDLKIPCRIQEMIQLNDINCHF